FITNHNFVREPIVFCVGFSFTRRDLDGVFKFTWLISALCKLHRLRPTVSRKLHRLLSKRLAGSALQQPYEGTSGISLALQLDVEMKHIADKRRILHEIIRQLEIPVWSLAAQ